MMKHPNLVSFELREEAKGSMVLQAHLRLYYLFQGTTVKLDGGYVHLNTSQCNAQDYNHTADI